MFCYLCLFIQSKEKLSLMIEPINQKMTRTKEKTNVYFDDAVLFFLVVVVVVVTFVTDGVVKKDDNGRRTRPSHQTIFRWFKSVLLLLPTKRPDELSLVSACVINSVSTI